MNDIRIGDKIQSYNNILNALTTLRNEVDS